MKKILLGFILGGIVCTSVTLVIASALYKASDVSYTNPKSEVTNVQDAINEILEKNGLIRFNEELGYIQARTTKDTWINLYKTKSVPIVAYNLTVNVSHSTNSSSVRITVIDNNEGKTLFNSSISTGAYGGDFQWTKNFEVSPGVSIPVAVSAGYYSTSSINIKINDDLQSVSCGQSNISYNYTISRTGSVG